MQLRDTTEGFGPVTRWLHWVMAVAIFVLFGLGYWMVGLDYTSAYYNTAPAFHESLGMLVLLFFIFRLTWRLVNPRTNDPELSSLERRLARTVHGLMYATILIVLISGYLISTADGRSVAVFGFFEVPSLVQRDGLETPAGKVHYYAAYVTILLAIGHTLAALKHHFWDGKPTLIRIWRDTR
jgi:cytochrome b561